MSDVIEFKPIGPKHLRIIENGFLKPATRNDGARTSEEIAHDIRKRLTGMPCRSLLHIDEE